MFKTGWRVLQNMNRRRKFKYVFCKQNCIPNILAHHRLELKYTSIQQVSWRYKMTWKSKSSIGSGSLTYLISSTVSGSAFFRPEILVSLWKHNSWQLDLITLFCFSISHKTTKIPSWGVNLIAPFFAALCLFCGFGKTSVLHLDES